MSRIGCGPGSLFLGKACLQHYDIHLEVKFLFLSLYSHTPVFIVMFKLNCA